MLIKAPYQSGRLEFQRNKEGHMPFSKINPGTTIDSAQPSNRTLQRMQQKKNRQSGKLSPKVSQAVSNWQRQCRMLAKKPVEEAVK